MSSMNSINSMNSIGSDLYEGSSQLGVFQSFIGLIFGVIIGIVLIIVGSSFLFSQDKYISTTGNVQSKNCTLVDKNNNCVMNIKYQDSKGNSYINSLNTTNISYSIGQDIPIEYLESNPNSIRIPGLSNQTMGFISSLISIIIVALVSFNYYMTTHYKLYAAATGAKTVYGIFR